MERNLSYKSKGVRAFSMGCRCSFRVAGAEYPTELVRERFLNLDSSHVEYVAECMKDNTTRIRNIKQYMLTALFNAPATKDSFYRAEVQYDMCQSKM